MIGYVSSGNSHVLNNKPRFKDCGIRLEIFNICSAI
jgi:hypothetical protein